MRRRLIEGIVVALVAAAIVASMLLATVAGFGGVRTDGTYLDWSVVAG